MIKYVFRNKSKKSGNQSHPMSDCRDRLIDCKAPDNSNPQMMTGCLMRDKIPWNIFLRTTQSTYIARTRFQSLFNSNLS